MKSSFNKDLSKEQFLASYLDSRYKEVFPKEKYSLERVDNLDLQHEGIDLYLKTRKTTYLIDEKAQIDYLNHSLPTFAFELSYMKNKNWNQGWLFDNTKKTQIYFLITNIYTETPNLYDGIKSIKLTGIYRNRLINLLERRGLNKSNLSKIESELRDSNKHGKIGVRGLNPKTEGVLYYSNINKAEKPINLVLKLSFLMKEKVGGIILEN